MEAATAAAAGGGRCVCAPKDLARHRPRKSKMLFGFITLQTSPLSVGFSRLTTFEILEKQ